MKTRTVARKNVSFKLRDVQHMGEQNFGAVTVEEWAAVGRHVKAVEQEWRSREHEMDSVMERIIINTNDDDDDDDDNYDTSESTVSCDDDDDDDDIREVGPIISDSE